MLLDKFVIITLWPDFTDVYNNIGTSYNNINYWFYFI